MESEMYKLRTHTLSSVETFRARKDACIMHDLDNNYRQFYTTQYHNCSYKVLTTWGVYFKLMIQGYDTIYYSYYLTSKFFQTQTSLISIKQESNFVL